MKFLPFRMHWPKIAVIEINTSDIQKLSMQKTQHEKYLFGFCLHKIHKSMKSSNWNYCIVDSAAKCSTQWINPSNILQHMHINDMFVLVSVYNRCIQCLIFTVVSLLYASNIQYLDNINKLIHTRLDFLKLSIRVDCRKSIAMTLHCNVVNRILC